jgi:thiazole/oxazole-forming peptide maturase SagD family component
MLPPIWDAPRKRLRRSVRQAAADAGPRNDRMITEERERMKALEREVRELRTCRQAFAPPGQPLYAATPAVSGARAPADLAIASNAPLASWPIDAHEISTVGWDGQRVFVASRDRAWHVEWSGAQPQTVFDVIGDPRFARTFSAAVPEALSLAAIAPRWAVVPLDVWIIEWKLTRRIRPVLVVRADEALMLPDPACQDAALALRLFVSGVQPHALLQCYARTSVTGRRSVVGDAPAAERVLSLGETLRVASPAVVNLGTGEISEFGQAPGRLHPLQRLEPRDLLLETAVIHRSIGTLPASNLRFAEGVKGRRSWGAASERAVADVRATGEAIERFAAGSVDARSLTRAAAVDLQGRFLDPHSVVRHSEDQLARRPDLRPFAVSQRRWWIKGRHAGGEPVWVLADLVFYPFAPPGVDRRVHGYATSSGMACHPDRQIAERKSVDELIERDALLRQWHAGVPPRRIASASLPPLGQAVIEAFEARGWRAAALDVSTSQPVVVTVALRDHDLVLGAAAGPPHVAAERAALEAAGSLTGGEHLALERPEDVRSPDDHEAYYRFGDRARRGSFLLASSEIVQLESIRATTPGPTAPTFVDYPVARRFGMHVVRALVPGLIPMTFGYDNEPLGLPAFQRLMRGKGMRLEPHPFA